MDEDDKQGYFKDIHKNKRRQRGLKREMNKFVKDLEIPLYDNMKNIQFHDTLNGIIGAVYRRLHKAVVEERE